MWCYDVCVVEMVVVVVGGLWSYYYNKIVIQ